MNIINYMKNIIKNEDDDTYYNFVFHNFYIEHSSIEDKCQTLMFSVNNKDMFIVAFGAPYTIGFYYDRNNISISDNSITNILKRVFNEE